MTTDRDLLTQLFTFLKGRNYITMDDISLTDMVKRYQNPPLTAYNRVAMQMTTREYNALAELMKVIDAQLKAEDEADEEWIAEQKQRMAIRMGKPDEEKATFAGGIEAQWPPISIPASDEAVWSKRYDEG